MTCRKSNPRAFNRTHTLETQIAHLLSLGDRELNAKLSCNHMAVFLDQSQYKRFAKLLDKLRPEFIENELLAEYGSDEVNEIVLRDLKVPFFVSHIARVRKEPEYAVRRRWLEFLEENLD